MNKHTALVVGGNGIVGRSLTAYLSDKPDWEVVVTSRTALHYETPAAFVPLDLNDETATEQAVGALEKVSSGRGQPYAPML